MAKAWIVKPHRVASTLLAGIGTAAGTLGNVGNDYAGIVWRSAPFSTVAIGGVASVTVDLGADMAADTVMLFGVSGLTGGNVVLRAAIAGAGDFEGGHYVSPAVPIFAADSLVQASGKRVVQIAIPPTQWAGFKRFRLEFSGIAGTEHIEIARVVIGQRIELARNFSFGAGFGVRDLGSADFSPTGAFLRRRSARLRTVGLTFPAVHKDEAEARVKPLLEQAGNGEPVALVTDPAADPMRERRSYFGPLTGDLGTVWRVADGFEWRALMTDLFPIPKAI